MVTKSSRVVTYNEKLSSIKSHDPLITWRSDLDFPSTIVGLEHKGLSRHRLLVALACKAKPFGIISLFFFCRLFLGYREFRAKIYFTNRRTANTIQLFVAMKGKFPGPLFLWACWGKGKFPREIPKRLLDKRSYLFICISLK